VIRLRSFEAPFTDPVFFLQKQAIMIATEMSHNHHVSFLMRKNSGFTLVEVLASVMLLSIGLLAILASSQVSRETQIKAEYLSIARNLAQDELEKLRATSFSSLGSSIPDTSSSLLPKISVSCTLYPNNTEPYIYLAKATVTWPEKSGTRKVCYETLISKKGK
jgi:prepilin-type N-terminal cleavage/methylation domain-containing protein